MNQPLLSLEDVQKRLKEKPYTAQSSYLAMYSSWFGGIVKDPSLMFIPVDDHLVHRGDGVFEAIKVVDGLIYLLEPHLCRLESSAAQISLTLPMSKGEIKDLILQTTRQTEENSMMLRLYVSRGPGYFSANPYDSVGSQVYLIATRLAPLPCNKYEEGVAIGRSAIPPKDEWMARIKSCNYLPNVMMKKEAVDRRLDFTIGIDGKGFLTESSTENIVLLDKNKILVRPLLRQILKGTTMTRVFDLAEKLLSQGLISGIEERDLSEQDLFEAKEAFMIGTTLDVLPIVTYEGKIIGEGKGGPVARQLLKLLREDIKMGPYSTPI